jgi:hypothetical protein
VAVTEHVVAEQLPELALREHGRVHDHLLGMVGTDIEKIGFAAIVTCANCCRK